MRVHEFAKANGVQSKYVVAILKALKPHRNYSPSTRLEIGPDNKIYFESVAANARELQRIAGIKSHLL